MVGRSLNCQLCDYTYRGLNHSACVDPLCQCPQHDKDRKGNTEEILDDYGKPTGMIRTSYGLAKCSNVCLSYKHSQCGDDGCECWCHTNRMTGNVNKRWRCPRCRAWVWEPLAKVCQGCFSIKVPEERSLEISHCLYWIHENCIDRGTAKADACEHCKPLYPDLTKLIEDHNNGIKKLTAEEEDLIWAASINSYPHKNMRSRLKPTDDASDREKQREWKKKGITKALMLSIMAMIGIGGTYV